MEIRRGDYRLTEPTAVALGNFDGVHLGHRALISSCVSYAREKGLKSAVCTFGTHPRKLFSGRAQLITDADEKARRIESLGVDCLLIERFDREYARMSPCEFAERILAEKFGAAAVFCGENYRFGEGGRGDVSLLKEKCGELGIDVFAVSPVTRGGRVVSSSLIREYISGGQIEKANELLGQPFSLVSEVAHGKELGRTLGLPTINLSFAQDGVIPAYGVYAARVSFGGRAYCGAANVGVRPTVDGHGVNAEINIFGFDGDLYGRTVRAELCSFIRPERRFEATEQLKLQIIKDKSDIGNYFKSEAPTPTKF